ncbi:MAG: SIS domain-containing protein, partial [Acidobacteriota bacterium]
MRRLHREHAEAAAAFFKSGAGVVERIAAAFIAALRAGRTLLFFGNGGSAADAQHLAAEFVNRFVVDRPGLPALALTTDTSVLTSIGNDQDFARVFSRQVEALGRPGDVAVGISTSGRSANVLEGLRAERARGLVTVG